MEYRKLGNTNESVSLICLGTMTFGEQNTEADGHEQMSYALDQGINFFDTAEMYSVPGRKETQGSTERILGTWFQKTGNRDKVILASKATGPIPYFDYIHHGVGFTKERINQAIEGSLSRLQTDYIDLYQLHFPERKMNMFGVRGYAVHDSEWEDRMAETVEALHELIKEGKIKYWGLSNESPWGIMRYREISKELGCPMPVSIQNPYNLLNRTYELGLSEISIREKTGLLAYSPLAFGRLTGKFNQGMDDENCRINKFARMSRYNGENSLKATALYLEIAEKHGLSLTDMSLAFVNSQFFLTSNIIGATSMAQLIENINSINVTLSDEVVKDINAVHELIPDPAP
jgi:aryl-alcohol dehydrogenase-like predicted oxidoreductase